MNTDLHAEIARWSASLLQRGTPPSRVRAAVDTLNQFAARGRAIEIEVDGLVLRLPGKTVATRAAIGRIDR